MPSESQIIDFRLPESAPPPQPMHFGAPVPPAPEAFVPPPVAPPFVANESPEPVAVPAPAAAVVVAAPMPPPLVALPLVWFNAGADLFLRRFGPPGRFLTTNTGRNLLGWAGILLCVAAVGIAARDVLGIGWTP